MDFGSSALPGADTSFTMRAGVWRKGTPAYAPPEMLTADVELPEGYRASETIDIYALCSVLYELYARRPPYDTALFGELSPYRVKTESPIRPLDVHEPDGGMLAAIIMAGLAIDQEARPNVSQLKAALENWRLAPQRRASVRAPRSPHTSAVWQPGAAQRRTWTRRALVAGGIVTVAAIASGALVASRLSSSARIDESRYARTDAVYTGEALFKALDGARAGWALYTASGDLACKPDSSRECGTVREGLVALYDDISRLYGYIAPTEKGAYAWKILPAFAQAGDFSHGLACAQDPDSGLWGFVNVDGAWVIEPRFAQAGSFSHGAAAVQASGASALWGALDTAGSWLIEPRFSALGARDENGCAVAEQAPGSWGIVDGDGEATTAMHFRRLGRMSGGLAPAADAHLRRWGFVDASGQRAIDADFKDARPFQSGRAAVQDVRTQLWYFIDAAGKPSGSMTPP